MSIVESLLGVLQAGLMLWNHKEKSKYVDRLIALKKDYYAEWNKPEDVRSDAVLDHIVFELRLLGDSFAAGVISQNSKT